MERTIILDGKEVRFRASAAIPRLYRLKFHRDIIHDMSMIQRSIQRALPPDQRVSHSGGLESETSDADTTEPESPDSAPEQEEEIAVPIPLEALTLFENVAYLMARHADPSVPDNVDAWLDEFETFSIYQVFPVIQEMWSENLLTLNEPKKK